MTLERAIEAFVGGCCFTRSFTYPYERARIGPLWAMRDVPARKDQRTGEVVAGGVPPSEVLELLRPDPPYRHTLCAIDSPQTLEKPIVQAYKEAGYRFLRREWMMFRPLDREIGDVEAPYPVRRIRSVEENERVSKATRMRMLLPEHVGPVSPMRAYYAHDGERIVGYVRSIAVEPDAWVSAMFVSPEYRRRGIARSLLLGMLAEDRSAGLENSVLLASSAGAMLYPCVGYETIGILRCFTPPRRS